MMLSHWHSKGFTKLIEDRGYNGTTKPVKTIKSLKKKQKSLNFGDMGTATIAKTMKTGLNRWVKTKGYKGKLKVKRMQALRGHKKIMQQLMKNIDEGHPTIMLFNKRKAQLGSQCVNMHYVVAVGYDVSKKGDEKILALEGWKDGSRSETRTKAVEVPFKGSKSACNQKLRPGLIWLED